VGGLLGWFGFGCWRGCLIVVNVMSVVYCRCVDTYEKLKSRTSEL
jgi:hypothetical protein